MNLWFFFIESAMCDHITQEPYFITLCMALFMPISQIAKINSHTSWIVVAMLTWHCCQVNTMFNMTFSPLPEFIVNSWSDDSAGRRHCCIWGTWSQPLWRIHMPSVRCDRCFETRVFVHTNATIYEMPCESRVSSFAYASGHACLNFEFCVFCCHALVYPQHVCLIPYHQHIMRSRVFSYNHSDSLIVLFCVWF